MGRAVALADDMFFIAKMKETARQVGVEIVMAGTVEALIEAARIEGTALLIVDLNARGGIAALERFCTDGHAPPVIAYHSHVQTELAERARSAGCREVMSRSKFTKELAEILARAKT